MPYVDSGSMLPGSGWSMRLDMMFTNGTLLDNA
jgi:hypothetical protein